MAGNNIYKVAIDSLSAHVAILNEEGDIIETNTAWREFGYANGICTKSGCVGMNYIDVCRQSSRHAEDEPAIVARAIRRVMAGELEEFLVNYPCHSPREQRWFALRIVRFREPGSRKVILTHENITPLILVQESLQQKESELRDKSLRLEESNIALKVLLKQREQDQRQLEENMLSNVRELILPYVDKLLEAGLGGRERTLARIVRERLDEIISPFLNRLSVLKILTPREIQVASLVREGRSSKEIAEVLMISVSAVDFHRKQLRKKLKLSGTGTNLRSHLLSLQ